MDYVVTETLPVVEDAVNKGKAKYIGITGYPVSTLHEFVEKTGNKVDTILSYCRLSLIDQTLDEYLPSFLVTSITLIYLDTSFTFLSE